MQGDKVFTFTLFSPLGEILHWFSPLGENYFHLGEVKVKIGKVKWAKVKMTSSYFHLGEVKVKIGKSGPGLGSPKVKIILT